MSSVCDRGVCGVLDRLVVAVSRQRGKRLLNRFFAAPIFIAQCLRTQLVANASMRAALLSRRVLVVSFVSEQYEIGGLKTRCFFSVVDLCGGEFCASLRNWPHIVSIEAEWKEAPPACAVTGRRSRTGATGGASRDSTRLSTCSGFAHMLPTVHDPDVNS